MILKNINSSRSQINDDKDKKKMTMNLVEVVVEINVEVNNLVEAVVEINVEANIVK
jgi:hypothetical protein